MSSVTDRIRAVNQPRGGYLKPSSCEKFVSEDGIVLNENENISPQTVGRAVDYLSRFANGADFQEAFKIPLSGVSNAMKYAPGLITEAELKKMKTGITGLDDNSVDNACKLAAFDIWGRNLRIAQNSSFRITKPDPSTVKNIQTMVQRSLTFFKKYGPVVQEGFRFDPISEQIINDDGSVVYNMEKFFDMMESRKGSYGGYTPTVEAGEGDFLTADTLWEFKVMRTKITSQITLQLLMYWIMGQHSGQEIYKNITKLGIFNPRLNTVFLYDIRNISPEVIRTVEKEVICYE